MKITPVPHGLDDIIGQSAGPRSPGLHISDLYNSLYQDLEPKRYANTGGPNTLKMAMGLAWEAHLEKCFLRAGLSIERPDECMTEEGIAFSPDLIIFNGHIRQGEIKLSYMSEADSLDDPKFAKWLTQAKAYCHHLGTNLTTFYVLFVNGNYRDRRDPSFRAYEIEWTAQELKDNWQMLLNHGRHKGLI